MIWGNRMIESRLAVAQQLNEISHIMQQVAEDLYDISAAEPVFQEELTKSLRKRHVILKRAWVMDKVEGRRQIFLTMRARSGQCVAVSEISQILSGICECTMTSAQGSRCIVNRDFHTVHFVEDVSYQMLYGVAKLTREKEKVSGDNYICRQEDARKICDVSFRRNGIWDGCVQRKRDCGRTTGAVHGIWFFTGGSGENGQFCPCSEWAGWYVFHS